MPSGGNSLNKGLEVGLADLLCGGEKAYSLPSEDLITEAVR